MAAGLALETTFLLQLSIFVPKTTYSLKFQSQPQSIVQKVSLCSPGFEELLFKALKSIVLVLTALKLNFSLGSTVLSSFKYTQDSAVIKTCAKPNFPHKTCA